MGVEGKDGENEKWKGRERLLRDSRPMRHKTSIVILNIWLDYCANGQTNELFNRSDLQLCQL